ncbi:AAA family ATPase [Tautonia sp. JC769]|uniref:AAA family ATPase n=2 Tax=Planctomycetia TaxID=203683 RepID=UPI003458B6A8
MNVPPLHVAEPTPENVAAWLRPLVEPGSIIELRVLGVIDNPNYPAFTVAGCFDSDHLDPLAKIALAWTPKAEGVYVTINPLVPDMLALASNRVKRKPKTTAADENVVRRVGIAFDADPRRSPSGISSTDEEKALAWDRIIALRDDLTARGWPPPILADSGNGYHLRYRVDLPSDDGGLIARALKAADARFSDDRVQIDPKLFNPARVIKLYGSMARKGDSTPNRPHRWTAVLEGPTSRGDYHVVPRELLEALASEAPSPADRESNVWSMTAGTGAADRARAYIFAPGFPDAIEGENGHGRLYHVACVLVDGFGLSEADAYPIFAEWNEAKARPPESEKQLRHKLADAVKNHPSPSCKLLNAPMRDREGSDSGREGESTGQSDGLTIAYRRLEVNQCVMAVDRPGEPNYGFVLADEGDWATVVFRPGEEGEAEVRIHKSDLRLQDGSPLELGAGDAEPELLTTCMADIKAEPVKFLVPVVIPRGKLVTAAGLGGAGKGMFWSALVADMTRGRPTLGLDYDPPPPCDVLLLGCEDGSADTIKPRLLANDADVRRVHTLDGVKDAKGKPAPFSLAQLAPLDAYLSRRPEVKLVIIDPITGYVGAAGIRDHHDAELRSILEPLAKLANDRGVTILTVKHLNKDEAKTVASRVGGSIAYVNVPRACFAIASDPADDSRRVLAPFKWNLNVPRPTSIGWTLESPPPDRVAAILAESDHLSEADRDELGRQLFRLNWQGPVDISADDLLQTATRSGKAKNQGEIDRATDWLRERLKDGPASSITCAKEGDEAIGRSFPEPGPELIGDELNKQVLGRVKWWRETILKKRLAGESKRAGFNGPYFFRLPETPWPPTPEAIREAERANEAAMPSGLDALHSGPNDARIWTMRASGTPVEAVEAMEEPLGDEDSTDRTPRADTAPAGDSALPVVAPDDPPDTRPRGIHPVEATPLKGDSTASTDSTGDPLPASEDLPMTVRDDQTSCEQTY